MGIVVPREHGAYGQLLFPLATALALGRPSGAAAWLTVAVVAGFLAHEGLVVRLGLRGSRALRDSGDKARRSLASFGIVALIAGGLAIGYGGRAVLWAMWLPALLSAFALMSTWRGTEHSTWGEILAATALAAWGLPVAAVCGVDRSVALASWGTWTATFVVATLAVHAVVARTTRRPARANAAAALMVGGAALLVASWVSLPGLAPHALWMAQLPALLLAGGLVALPVSARRLHRVGWAIIAVCMLTMASLVVAFSRMLGI